jgi:hypothetical protein
MWMIWESGTKSLREIGEVFGGLDYTGGWPRRFGERD